ncbi:G5 domain-containing protein [Streptococcus suis]|uniref:G5 domain-containing protein n=2 Tax=Streptococcus suis TaxID=1307 RepID=UPI000CF5966D|nr:G5 domain-containing protein [Streptococcus suis]HEM6578097.1 G5 domain-containing protein [Streptococcus suis]
MVYSRTQRIQEEKKQRLRYGIRKFTGLGAASALLGVGLLTSLSVQAQTKTAEVRYDYVTTKELTEAEKKAIFTELPAQVTEDVTYYLVYRKAGASILPQTGENTGILAGAIGAGLLLVGITVGRKNQRLVRSAMTLTLVGGSLVFTSVSAVTVAQLAQYGQTQTLTVGAALPDGKISIAGYEFVGYLEGKKQSSETSPTLPTGSIDKAEENENLPVQPTQPVDENKSDIPAESTPSEDKVTDASAEQKPSEDKVISETEKPVQPEIPAPVEKPAVPGETETTVIPGEEKPVSPELPTNPAEPDRPVDTVRTDVEKQVTVIKYGTSYVKDTSLPAGESKVLTQGVDGKQTVTTKVTYTNNVETAHEIVATETIEPVTEVIAYNDEVSKNREELIESLTTVSFATERRANADLEVGSERVLVAGVNGQTKTLTKKVYDSTGAVISDEVVSTEVIAQPVTQVIEYGTKPKAVVETTEETKVTELDYTVETRQNSDLEKGQTRTLTEGRKGTLAQTYRITKTNGNETARELVKEERVEPVNEIIEVGTKAVVRYQTRQETSVIPFTTETRQVDSLFEGESRELVAGVDGQQTQTYKDTYVDGVKVASEMVGQPEVIQPIKRIVEVGIKKEETSQVLTETEVLAYTSIKEEDPNLPEGETKIKVQGVNGERKVRITRVTNNRTGQVSEAREVISETAPVNEVLVVGTKPASTNLLDKKTLTLDEFMSLTEEQQDAFIAKKGGVTGDSIRTGATKETFEKIEMLINLQKLNDEFVRLLNQARLAEGLSSVSYGGIDSVVQAAATQRANEMADHGSLRYQGEEKGAHYRPNGTYFPTVYTQEQRAQQGWRGENSDQLGTALSASKASNEVYIANTLFSTWMRSAGHKAVMMKDLNNLQVAVGIGLSDKAIESTFRNGVTVAMLELIQPKP